MQMYSFCHIFGTGNVPHSPPRKRKDCSKERPAYSALSERGPQTQGDAPDSPRTATSRKQAHFITLAPSHSLRQSPGLGGGSLKIP